MVQRLSKWFLFMLVIGTIVLVGLKNHEIDDLDKRTTSPIANLELKNDHINFNLKTPDGEWQAANELLRPNTVLIFSAAWCQNDNEIILNLKKLEQEVDEEALKIIYMSLDQSGESCKNFLDKQNIKFTSLMVPPSQLNKYPSLINGVPTVIVLNQSGKIIKKYEGDINYSRLKETIIKTIKIPDPKPGEVERRVRKSLLLARFFVTNFSSGDESANVLNK